MDNMENLHGIYDLNGRLERVIRVIQNSKRISETNKTLTLKFRDESFAEGLSTARVLFYMNRLWNIARWVEKDLGEMTEDDIKELVRRIAQMNYSERTKTDHYCVIKSSSNGSIRMTGG